MSLDELRALEQAACPFCEYAGPCELLDVYRGVYFIEPISPVTDGHVLAIPFAHVTDVIADPEIAGETMRAAAWFAADRCVGECNLITSVGEAATQTVKHLHVHIVPRSEGDGLALPWSSLARVAAAEAERDALAKQLDEALSANHDGGYAIIGLQAERDALRSFVNGLALASLLDIRRAAFAPEIGVRYTEAIRADIAGACFRLEDACTAALAASVPSGPAAAGPTTSKETR